MSIRAAALAGVIGVLAAPHTPVVMAPQRYALAPATIAPVAMGASCLPEASAAVDTGAAWLLVRAPERARGAFDRAADADPDCALAYWGQAVSRFEAPASGSPAAIAPIEAAIARAASVPARTAFERAAVAALVRLRAREAAPGVAAAWPARVAAYRIALCEAAATDARVRLWCARALADAPRAAVPGQAGDDHAVALAHAADLVREGAMDVGVALIVLDAAADLRAPIVARAVETIARVNPPAPHPQARAAEIAARRGDWAAAVVAAERATAASPPEAPSAAAVDAQLEALFQLGRRAHAYALAHRLANQGRDDAPELSALAARAVARAALADRRLDGRGLGDLRAVPLAERTAGRWPVVVAAGLDAALRAWPGGDRAQIARAREALAALDAIEPLAPAPEIPWARTLIEAAIAASQDEHQELALRLTHAADLERALVERGQVSLPLVPTAELAAELWLRTYRYDDARRAARTVVEAVPTRVAPYVVLARAAARTRDEAAAADHWRRVLELRAGADADDTLRIEARGGTAR